MIGQKLGHYSIQSLLGKGGMGEVYLARDDRLHRDVALKVISRQAMTGDLRARFRREALALSKLNHPNVATIHDVGQESDVDFLVMEFVDGPSLDQRIRERPLTTNEILDLGRQLADGLAAAHAQGLIHRDLKPANLKITPDGRLKILDFGLARLESTSADASATDLVTKGIVGTVPYMAPEQLGGGETDARTDVYGACAVLYEMATGKRPHHDRTGAALMTAILSTTPEPPSRARAGVPGDLDALIMKGLEKDPSSRYADGAALVEEFRRLRDGLATDAGRVKRRRTIFARIIPAIILAMLVAIVLTDAGGVRTGVGRWIGLSDDPIRSLVVLPMEDLSPENDSDLRLGSALTFELTTSLQRISALPRVISPRTARQFAGSTMDPREIARELDVDGIVDASFQLSDDEIRVQISLVEASTGSTLWAESYQRELSDLLGLQHQLAATIAAQIGAVLSPEETAALSHDLRVDPLALQAYEEALTLIMIGLDTTMNLAVEKLQTVVLLAPTWPDAHAQLALACAWSWGMLGENSEVVQLGKKSLATALQLDPDLAVAHCARGMQEFWFNFDLIAARNAHERASDLDPLNPVLSMHRSLFWAFARDADKAISIGKRAVDLDPLNPSTSRSLAWIYYDAGRWEDALAQHDVTRSILERGVPDPTNETFWTEYQTTWNLLELGRIDEMKQIANDFDISLGLMDSCLISLAEGDTLFVRSSLERPIWERGPWFRGWSAALHARLGDPGPAFDLIDTYYRERNPRLWWMMNENGWPGSVVGDLRWAEWRQQLGLPN